MKKGLLINTPKVFAFLVLLPLIFPCSVYADNQLESSLHRLVSDTLPVEDSVSYHLTGLAGLVSGFLSDSRDSLDVEHSSRYPVLALQQHLKGNLKGVYVQTPSMEPGSKEHMFVRGLAKPLLSHQNVYENQPTVYLNGIPLITDHPFVYDIQKFTFNPIGSATNLLAAVDMDNVASIKVLKSPEALAILGPLAANGAIMITTKNAHAGEKQISLNGYYGVVPAFDANPVNAVYIAKRRQPFYDKYASAQANATYPGYLANTSDPNYYGPANWTDLYYKNAMVHNVNGSLTGGTERANFRFFGGASKGASGIDGTKLNRYTAAFSINMLPLTWLTVSATMRATRLNRQRNRSLRDRLAEMDYFPDLTYPLAPNKALYSRYVNAYENVAFDKNRNNVINGSFAVKAELGKWMLSSQLAFDYNEGSRDLFWPSTLLEGNNYASGYFESNRRLILNNRVSYEMEVGSAHRFVVEAGQSLRSDKHSYNYAYAYKGPSDYIKINAVDGNKNHSDYLEPKGFIAYRFIDRLKSHLLSFYGHLDYSYKGLLDFDAIIRSDASSFAQPTSRWFLSPALSLGWNLKQNFFKQNQKIDHLELKASWGRVGRLFTDGGLGAGPQYRVNVGWNGVPRMGSYNGVATLTRPYSKGWVGYQIKWPYTETKSLRLSVGLFDNRLNADATIYIEDNKRMVLGMPTLASSGYEKSFKQGLWVRNQGVEIGLSGMLIRNRAEQFVWTIGGNISLNKNILKGLPGENEEVIIGERKLVVGKSVDQFWLLQNEGIYKTTAEVPVNPATNRPLNYKGIAMQGGDAKWKDTNGDYIINDKDRVMEGHILPDFFGGFHTALEWKAFSLSANFYYAVGQSILNQEVAHRLDFINVSSASDISTTLLKDVTFWQKTFDPLEYPEYNPWSEVKPYQLQQDLYLEEASFLKLKSISLGYDMSKSTFFRKAAPSFNQMLIYVAANNVFTLTPYSGKDPEIMNYMGYNTGYGMPVMRSFTVGLKVEF